MLPLGLRAQYNINRLLTSGQVALHYEDYVLSIQYFNQIIALKPHLYLPWQLRAAAKYYLDDFVGAEADATEAMMRNPYVNEIYDLRAITRIRQKKYEEAIADYNQAIRLEPSMSNYRYNRAICRMNLEQYEQALQETDTLINRWATSANAYTLKAEIYLHMKDTTSAAEWLDKSLKVNAFDAGTWTVRGYISMSRKEWRDADKQLSEALHLRPKNVANYLNRAVCRVNYNNLRGAMDDYDLALDLDPNNFLGHYNRGLLRMQLGDDNRAIDDFDYVLKMEPNNIMAIINRAELNYRTGNLREALRDYTSVINEYPNFWTGLSRRAEIYRALGQSAKAEMDEFRIFRAQMDKHIGIQPRWNKETLKQTRHRSEIDIDKYSQLVVEDEEQPLQEYKRQYRGQVQRRQSSQEFLPMFEVSFLPTINELHNTQVFCYETERFNTLYHPLRPLYLSVGNNANLGTNAVKTNAQANVGDQSVTNVFFGVIDSLSTIIQNANNVPSVLPSVMQRGVAYCMVRSYDEAINDFNVVLQNDSTSVLALLGRAVSQQQLSGYQSSEGVDISLSEAKAADDLKCAISFSPNNQYLHYNFATMQAIMGHYDEAIESYTRALQLDDLLAEAYFNRGIAYSRSGDSKAAIRDLSKAGELGIYTAYSIIKKLSKSAK